MVFKKTLAGIVIATNLCLPARADENISHSLENNNKYAKKEENPIYPIMFTAGSLAAAAGAAYYAIKEGKRTEAKLLEENRIK